MRSGGGLVSKRGFAMVISEWRRGFKIVDRRRVGK